MAQNKIDKEFLIKHRFWISVPVALLFVLIAWVCVLSVRGATADNFDSAEKVDKELKSLEARGSALRNPKWNDAMGVKTNDAVKQKTDLWYEVYDRQNGVDREPPVAQPAGDGSSASATGSASQPVDRGRYRGMRNPMITWPQRMYELQNWPLQKEIVPLRDKDFGEPLSSGGAVPPEFKEDFDRQYEDLAKIVDFLDERTGKGATRLKLVSANHKENIMSLLVPQRWNQTPILDYEAWLAQEDIAIKREMLQALNEANNAIAVMQPEWRNVNWPEVVKNTEVNQGGDPAAAAGTAPAPAPNPPTAPMNPMANANGEGGEEPKDARPAQPLDQKRFLNSTWQIGLVDTTEKTDERTGEKTRAIPSTQWWDGWMLDLELLPKDGDVVLQGASANLNVGRAAMALPNAARGGKLLITVSNDSAAKPDFREYEVDAGDLPATKESPESRAAYQDIGQKPLRELKGLSQKSFILPLKFKDARKIVKVQRAFDKNGTVLDHQRFVNPNWLLDAQLLKREGGSGPGVVGTVYNRSGRRLLPVAFEVTYTTDGKDSVRMDPDLKISGDAFNAWTQRNFDKVVIKSTIAPSRLVGVKQILTWQTVPIKRLDKLLIGLPAHMQADRTKITPLSSYDFAKKDPLKQPGATDPAPAASSGAAAPGPAGGTVGGGLGGPAGGTGGGGTATSPNHGIPLKRYYEVTEELRRLPVALVMIVDAERTNDVLTAFANSRTRFRTTMAPWTRVAQLSKPAFAQPASPTGSGPGVGPGVPPRGPMGPMGPGGYPGLPGPGPMGGSTGSFGPPTPGTPVGGRPMGGGGPPVEDDSSVIELQIFGLITLYESPDALKRIDEERKKGPAPAPAPATP